MASRRTKIVATIGPASRKPEVLKGLIDAGVDVFRINGSHSTAESIRKDVAHIRRAARQAERSVGILLDLQGPKIRTSKMKEPLLLKAGDLLEVVMDEREGEGRRCGTTYTAMAQDVRPGDRVLFADGALSGEVEAVRKDLQPAEVHIRILDGGSLGSNKGINLPGVDISMPAVTEKDLADLEVGVNAGVDFVALSFVRRAEEVLGLREELGRLGDAEVPIIAKIEKPEALDNIQSILAAADGIMVARGDLGVEVPLETVPIHQKRLIRAANRAGALVITATQMLDSMERNPRPTRAEATDVANAILDGTDAVMLSGETAAGLYPIRAVKVMDGIAREVERSPFLQPAAEDQLPVMAGPGAMVARAASMLVSEVPRPLIVFTWSGHSAITASKCRPRGSVFALTFSSRVCDRLSLVWGVTPVKVPAVKSTDELIELGERVLIEQGRLEPGEEVVVLAGSTPMKGATNLLKVYTAGT
ncbi:MAG: pyruvate kinase [Alphaproteobacteria bacterium]|nr:pyruvate kinase [Alphaproteobacteria bacterium]MCB9791593.1 pyruvate kinase [Alphaproteobacteria bacterium]